MVVLAHAVEVGQRFSMACVCGGGTPTIAKRHASADLTVSSFHSYLEIRKPRCNDLHLDETVVNYCSLTSAYHRIDWAGKIVALNSAEPQQAPLTPLPIFTIASSVHVPRLHS